MQSRKNIVRVVVPLLIAGASAEQVWAQAPALEEVIVTAERRAASVQDTPIQIDVFDDENFVREGVRVAKDLEKLSSVLDIQAGGGQLVSIGMRGMRQVGGAPNGSSLAAVHLDGAYQASNWGLNGMLYDIERVEVLAGPQGTLYGRNSAAGVINFITKRPGRNFEGDAMVEAGAFNLRHMTGGVSIPLGETLSVRLAAMRNKRDALFEDGTSMTDVENARATLLWNVTPNGTLLASVDWGSNNTNGNGSTLYQLDPDVRAVTSVSAAGVPTYSATAVPASISNYTVPKDLYKNLQYQTQRNQVSTIGGLYTTNQDVWGAMAEYTHEFESFSGTLQYSHRDVSGVNYGSTRAPTQLFPNTQPGVIVSDIAELRFASTRPGAFQWVGGLFWMDSTVLGWNAAPSFAQTTADPATDLDIPWGASTNGGYPNNTEVESYSAYGQVQWTPPSMQKLRLSAGLRYNHDYNLYMGGYWASNVAIFAWGVQDMPAAIRPLFANVRDSAVNASGEYVPDRSWEAVQWRLAADYDLTDESMLYASVSTGYKSGALVAGPTPETKPEDLLAYELGSKNRFFNNRLQVNASTWLYDYSNLEQATNRPLGYSIILPNGTVSSTTVSRASVGKVRLFGLSGDINWLVTEADELGLSFTHIYSKILDGTEVSPTGQVNEILNEGERLGGAPEWTWIARYSHTFRFSSGATLDPGVKYRWEAEQWNRATIPGNSVPVGGAVNIITGRINLDRAAPPQTAIPSKGILDLSLRFVSASERWSATAYVNNATDELDIQSLAYTDTPGTYNATTRVFTPNATYGHNTATLGDPRTWGISFDFKF